MTDLEKRIEHLNDVMAASKKAGPIPVVNEDGSIKHWLRRAEGGGVEMASAPFRMMETAQ